MKYAFITATPPTPNGGLHVGHLAGPYIAADVLRRHLVASGVRALLTTGMDDHQTYVPRAALVAGKQPGELADECGDSIDATWKAAGVEFDVSIRPRRDPSHVYMTQRFLRKLYDDGFLVARTHEVPFCTDCDRWLVEAWVKGSCPHCGASSGGNACEDCGRPNHCGDLVDPHCVVCGEPGTPRAVERLFFPLARLERELVDFWNSARMPPHLRALCETMLADGLPEIAVTQLGDWGIPVPVDGFSDQGIYVWFEMAPGYLHEAWRAAEGIGLGNAKPLTSDPAVPFVQFFGFDNGYFHAVLFPALFMAYDRTLRLPTQFVVNEFYRLDGLKFSTSRRHAVWAADLLSEEDPDVVRWHVLGDRPEGRQTNFTLDALAR
jgi:methionyl-tRNA synthetase